MAMTLRLSDDEAEMLRRQAEREHRSMQEVVRLAILDRIERGQREEQLKAQDLSPEFLRWAFDTLERRDNLYRALADQ